MVQINRLRLSGFKSFVDKTELDVGNGLNGIVGPNGCGKSNLVEALRWVMGENRAKNMRGGEMEDVIFAGTTSRPARSMAEVTVTLDNSDGRAPAPFGNSPLIEVTRRIEKDKGSHYLVNGKAVRARDVQLLFADALTGAHSPALVSQGRVTQLIGAKPVERRKMLEESAGVASLYTRRHEAELRLKAADENIARLELILGEMTTRANSLRNQAKSAAKYRDLSESIRRFETLLAWQEWGATRDRMKKEEARFAETDAAVREALTHTTGMTVAAQEAAEEVEIVRKTDVEARATLQLLRQTGEQLEREIMRRRGEYLDINRQIDQARDDLQLSGEQTAALRERASVIAADLARIEEEEADTPAALEQLEAARNEAQETVRTHENAVLELQDKIRRLQSEEAQAKDALSRATQQAERMADKLNMIADDFARAQEPDSSEGELVQVQASIETLKGERVAAEEHTAQLQEKLDETRAALNAARDRLATTTQEKDLKAREINSLNQLLNKLSQGTENAYILGLDIPADLATALAAAAGDAAMRAPEGDWAGLGDAFAQTDWPQGATPLNTLIAVPEKLATFASSIGLVESAETARALAPALKRGQVLVTRDGALWRWDGLNVSASAGESEETRILSLRAQIKEAQSALDAMAPALEAASAEEQTAITARDTLASQVAEAQQSGKQKTSALYAAEEQARRLEKMVAERTMRRTLLAEQHAHAQEAATAANESLAQAQEKAALFTDTHVQDDLRAQLLDNETNLASARTQRDEVAGQYEALKATAAQAKHLRDSLMAEAERTATQIANGESHVSALDARNADLVARKEALAPQITADEKGEAQQDMMNRIAEAEEAVRVASDAFAVADQKAKALTSDLKKFEEDGASAREKRAVIQATIAALQEEQVRITADIEDRFASSPAALENVVMTEWSESLPSQSKAKSEREHLMRERDAMGPVNLRADVELEENESESTRLEAEKADLAAAIARLREGILVLNTEARERIVKTFESVNTHFQDLFKRLFGGGDAYLKLEGAEDPLDCGLEIYAQPPGKSLQSLGLLSGGEQTLTALAMIFAMFLSNPAPICVLDEVDAPLDDANVDRVCGLLEEMSKNCDTRFLVITHHRMTMARMNRLYGVTMGERGVSQLVSVNMATQGDFLEQHAAA